MTTAILPLPLTGPATRKLCNTLLIVALLWSIVLPLATEPLPALWQPRVASSTATAAEADAPVARRTDVSDATPRPQPFTVDTAAINVAPPAPTTWHGYPELVARRDAYTRVYDLGQGRSAAVVAQTPRHYQDAAGHWQTYDPRFVPTDGGLTTTGTDLTVRLDDTTSAALIQTGAATVGWRPTQVLALDADGAHLDTLATPWSVAGEATTTGPARNADAQQAAYRGHWSDRTLAERFDLGAGRVEQSLVLSAPPQAHGATPAWFSLEAELFLLNGEELWANGAPAGTNFVSHDGLELRDAAGAVLLRLAPVLAYEARNPSHRVAGHYRGQELEPGVWQLHVVTPWAWWTDPARTYPAVLDPEFYLHVSKSTDIATSDCVTPADEPFAVPDCTQSDTALVGQRIQYGETFGDDILSFAEATSDIVFGVLPTRPQDAVMTAARLHLAGGLYGKALEIGVRDLAQPDWPQVASATVTPAAPLTSENFCYNREHSGNNCGPKQRAPVTVDIELPLPLVRDQWYAGNNAGVRLDVPVNGACESVVSSIKPDHMWAECTFAATEAVELVLFYDEATLSGLRDSIPVPTKADEIKVGTHRYELDVDASAWVGVAARVRGVGAVNPVGSQVTLNALSDLDFGEAAVFTRGAQDGLIQQEAINYFVMDGGSATLAADTWVGVDGVAANQPTTQYAVTALAATTLPQPTAQGVRSNVVLLNGRPLTMLQFDVPAESNLWISATVPADIHARLELFPARPSLGLEEVAYAHFARQGDGFNDVSARELGDHRQYVLQAQALSTQLQTWALAIPHTGRCDGAPGGCSVPVEVIACPQGSYFTERFGGCQELIYPHAQVLSEGGGPAIPATSVQNVAYNGTTLRIYSEGGFTNATGALGAYQFCTTNEHLGMPLIGLPEDGLPFTEGQAGPQRLIAVHQGSVCVTAENRIEITAGSGYGATVGPSFRFNARTPSATHGGMLFYHGRIFSALGDPLTGTLAQDPAAPERIRLTAGKADWVAPWAEWNGVNTVDRYIDVPQRLLHGDDQGTLAVNPGADADVTQFPVTAAWRVEGDFTNQRFNFVADTEATPPDMNVSSLTARAHAPVTLDTSFANENARVDRLLLTDATIHQSAAMGAAYRPIQAEIMRTGALFRGDGGACDAAACLEVRNPDDIDSADWDMPDVDVSGVAGSVLMQMAGQMNMYTDDHPDRDAIAAASGNFTPPDLDFNFRTFSGSVSTRREPCIVDGDPAYDVNKDGEADEDFPEVMVIHGVTNLALPSLGDGSDSGPGLRAEFRICQTKLRQVMVQFNAYPPGITVGPSGMVIKGIDGTVFIDPEFVNITIGTTFQSADGATMTKGDASVTIDTRGYFELAGGLKLVGTFSLDGSLVVAWSPLDILQQASISYLDWFEGYMRMHVWRGQGWGDPAPYPWLPDNNDFHFTGVIGAHFTITEGRIGEFFGIMLPPSDFVISVEVSFGEFCKNDACTAYEWGVQGKITVLDFNIGLYIGKSTGVDFILGDQGHVLIDQAFGVAAASLSAVPSGPISDIGDGQPLDIDPGPLCPEAGGVANCAFDVPTGAGELLAIASWSEGTLPTPTLLTPDGTAIDAVGVTPTVEPSMGALVYQVDASGATVRFVVRGTMILYTVENPAPGTWTLRLGNLTGAENYNVLFAANSPAPSLNLTAPDNVAVGATLDVAWNVVPADSTAAVQLSYIPEDDYAEYVAEINAGAAYSDVVGRLSGAIMVPQVAANLGSASWQPIGLASGAYRVVARLDHPVHGSTYAVSPGTFNYVDATPPAVPGNLLVMPEGDGLVAAWVRNTEADLAFYEVVYTTPSLDTPDGRMERRLRVPSSDPTVTHPTRERVRLVGTLPGIASTVCVRAVDASGNQSACSSTVDATPQVPGGLEIFMAPQLNAVTPAATGFNAQWQAGAGTDGSLLHWGGGCAANFDGPHAAEGATNLAVGNVTGFDITGLPAGNYRVAVRGYRAFLKSGITRITDFSNVKAVVVTDGVDGNGDGLPDDWAERYGVRDAAADSDGDGVLNGDERNLALDPTVDDSDADGVRDGDELNVWLTDPCDPTSVPDVSGLPQLEVEPNGTALRFTQAVNVGSSHTRFIHVKAMGIGELTWSASASHPWIKLDRTNGGPLALEHDAESIAVSVDVSGLAPGYYSGHVRIDAASVGGPVLNAPRFVPVRLWVLRPVVNVDTRASGYVFLDENADGVEDPGESTRLENVSVDLISAFGAVMTSVQTNVNGDFFLSQLPYADYALAARHSAYMVTTVDALPFTVSQGAQVVSGLRIGMARRDSMLTDQDDDGVPDRDEDVNGNGNLDDDDTDGDGTPDVRDPDDDGDSLPTRSELTAGAQAASAHAFADTDGDGLPDYRDVDDDGDGVPTIEEVPLGDTDNDGTPNYRDADDDGDNIPTALERRDTNGDGTPDYLDRNVDGSVGLRRVFLPVAARP